MKREFLKGLGLSDEVIEKVMVEHGKTITELNNKVNDATAERDSAKEQLETTNKQFEALKDSTKEMPELQQQLTTLKDERDKAQQEAADKLTATQKGYAIDLALRDAGARNSKSVRALLDEDKLEFKDGKIANLKDQLDVIQKDNDYLFQSKADPEKPHISPAGNPDPKDPEGNTMAAALGIK